MRLNASLRVFLMGGFATMMLASCQDNTASVSDVNETVENTEKAEAVMSKNTVLQKWTGPSGSGTSELFAIWGVHSSNLSNAEVRKIQGEWLPKISAFFDELALDPKLLEKTKAVYDKRKSAGLDAQQLRLVERGYEQLVRDGALLKGEDKEKLIALNTELSKQFNTFSNKVLADEETYIYHNRGNSKNSIGTCRAFRVRNPCSLPHG